MFRELKGRGLEGTIYVVSDDHTGLTNAIARYFQGVILQRCQVHFIRNVLGMASKVDRCRIVSLLKEITGAQTLESARNRLHEAADALQSSHPHITDYLDTYGE